MKKNLVLIALALTIACEQQKKHPHDATDRAIGRIEAQVKTNFSPYTGNELLRMILSEDPERTKTAVDFLIEKKDFDMLLLASLAAKDKESREKSLKTITSTPIFSEKSFDLVIKRIKENYPGN
jgi:hypothetical protein